ncbi:bZIP transcription factor [Psychrobacter sp. I-STPA6b]|uniref:bZIP transcription factor n=1 Tax=Psychrobacter sp. I-STPA6b TaxID=2585718 RepID=UPI001D0C1B9A|nr:bZIP transcription factor [Psychrobacter sp. I-STPA6b]
MTAFTTQPHLTNRAFFLAQLCGAITTIILLCLSSTAMAEPQVTVNPVNQTDNTTVITQNVDPQVAPRPSTPFNNNQVNNANGDNTSNNPANADEQTLASQLQPSANDLSEANQKLLSRNAQLQRDVNDLETQVNVLVNERSGQLFLYGAITVVTGLLVGIFIGWLVFSRRERW